MIERVRHGEVRYALVTAIASGVVAALVLRLWNASLGTPLIPGGDGYYALMQIKGIVDNGWVLTNSHLAAPFGQDLHDFAANRELVHVLIVKLLALFSSNPAGIYNAYYLLSFPLIGFSAYFVMRWLGVSRELAVAMSVLYAVAPYHFRHATFLWAYYTVPLGAYLIMAVYTEAPLFDGRRRSLLTLAVAAVVALSSFYYAGFTVLLVLMATVITFVVSRRRRTLATGLAIVVAIVAIGVIAQAPDLIYRARHGANPVAAKRSASDAQLYSTNLLQLVVPVPNHRVGRLRALNARWEADSRVDAEPTHLGLLAALGFVWLLALAVAAAAGARARLIRDPRQRHLALATLTTFLLGTTGGLSGVFAYTVTAQLRTWTRLSIFIAFFALAAIGLLLDAALEQLRSRGVRTPRLAVAAVLVVLCAVAVLDQTTSSNVPAYAANAAIYRSDDAFVKAIEQRIDDGGMVLQLPYVPFPENKPVGGTGSYDHVRPYLHSRTLRWSFGAMRGRPTDWQADTAGGPPEQFAPGIAAAGFDGVYVDRLAYPDRAADLEAELSQVLGSLPLASSDNRFSFFDVRPFARRLRSETSPGELQALADATLRPVRTDWSDGFAPRQQQGLDSSRWAQVSDPSLTIFNPSDGPRSTDLFVKLTRAGGDPAEVTITYPDGGTQRVNVPPDGVDVERTLRFPPGDSRIRFTIGGAAISAPPGATAGGYLQLVGWRLTPAIP
jgi:hypothetical protein